MKLKKVKWILVILFAFGLRVLCAQTSLNVNEKSGTITQYALNDLKKLNFSSGLMTLSMKNGDYKVFALINIRNINFMNVTSVDEIYSNEESNFMLYPNPAKDLLQVLFESKADENVLIRVINIQGKVVSQQLIKSHEGRNYIEIPVSSYQHGLYLCSLQIGNKIESDKFIKY